MPELKKSRHFSPTEPAPQPGPGGWGSILRYGSHELELSGGEKGNH